MSKTTTSIVFEAVNGLRNLFLFPLSYVDPLLQSYGNQAFIELFHTLVANGLTKVQAAEYAAQVYERCGAGASSHGS